MLIQRAMNSSLKTQAHNTCCHHVQEKQVISLRVDGEPRGFTAMAKLVGKPAAIAAKMILSGKVREGGRLHLETNVALVLSCGQVEEETIL